jgi:transposase-like protein
MRVAREEEEEQGLNITRHRINIHTLKLKKAHNKRLSKIFAKACAPSMSPSSFLRMI